MHHIYIDFFLARRYINLNIPICTPPKDYFTLTLYNSHTRKSTLIQHCHPSQRMLKLLYIYCLIITCLLFVQRDKHHNHSASFTHCRCAPPFPLCFLAAEHTTANLCLAAPYLGLIRKSGTHVSMSPYQEEREMRKERENGEEQNK